MNPISLALFDMDDVLCHYDRSARVRSLMNVSARSEQEVIDAIWGSGLEARADAGALSNAEYLLETGKHLGCRVTEEAWLQARKAAMSPNVEVLKLAKHASNYCSIAVLTNNPQLVAAHIDFLCPEIASVFGPHIYASASFKAAKPDTEVFLRCVTTLRVSPAETLFVDDLPGNVVGARSAGLNAHHFVDAQSLADELRSRGLLHVGS